MKTYHKIKCVVGFMQETKLAPLMVGDKVIDGEKVIRTVYHEGRILEFTDRKSAELFIAAHPNKFVYVGKS